MGGFVEGDRHDVEQASDADRRERKSYATEAKFRAIFEMAPFAISIADLKTGCFTAVNPAFEEQWFDAKDVIGKTPEEIGIYAMGHDRQRFRSALLSSGRVGPIPIVTYGRDKTTPITVLFSAVVVPLEPDPVVVAFGLDITPTQRAELALRESESRFRVLAEAAHEGIAITDQGRVVDANAQAAKMLGYEAIELIGRNVVDFVAPEDRKEVIARALANDDGPYEHFTLRKDGTRIAVEVRARTLLAGSRVLRVSAFRDITTRRKMEERLRQVEKLQAVGTLASGIAHDFNNLLTVIIGCAGMLDGANADTQRALIHEITAASQRAASLTRQLLVFSRRQVLDVRPVDLNEVVTSMVRMLERVLGEPVELETRLAPDLGLVRGDVGQMEQLLMNLCTNARDAMPNGGKLCITTARVDANTVPDVPGKSRASGPWVHLSVSDQGVGMTPEVLSRALEPFFTTKEVGRGTGLGLPTVRDVAAQAGGGVTLESSTGNGTCVHVWMPVCEEDASLSLARGGAPLLMRGKESVLLVEDDLGVRSLVARILVQNGYDVTSIGPAELDRAVETLDKVELVVTDVVMPASGGRVVLEKVRARHPAAKVLFVSGYSPEMMNVDGPFLAKPFTPNALLQRVREVLAS